MDSTPWLALLLAFSCFSCQLFQPVQNGQERKKDQGRELEPIQGSRVFNPQTGEWVTVREMPTEKMDTVRWRDVDESRFPPISSAGLSAGVGNPVVTRPANASGSDFLQTYRVSVLLPFLANRFNAEAGSIDPNSSWAIHFYGGVKMAIDELESQGVSLQISTMDTGTPDANSLPTLLRTNQDLRSSHLIIGPYRRENIREVADFARRNNINLVSPYSAAADLSSSNPNFIQVSPGLETHCAALTRHALSRYRPEQLVLVSRSDTSERSRLRFFQEEYFRLMGTRTTVKLQEYVVSSESTNYGNLDVAPFIQLQDTTVFLIPSWDETFIYAFMRKVDLSRQPYQTVVVYGMPQWMRFEHIDLDYFEKLKVHVSSNFFLDPTAPQVQFFRRQYYDRFGTIPPLESFLGYDVMLFFGRMLQKYGTKFQHSLDREQAQYLHTRFEFLPVVRPTTTGAERLPVERFENKYVNILKFEEYQFQLAN